MKFFLGWRYDLVGSLVALPLLIFISIGCPEPPPPTRGKLKRLAPRGQDHFAASDMPDQRDVPFADENDPGEAKLSKERPQEELCQAAYDNYERKISLSSKVASGHNSGRAHFSFLRLMPPPNRAIEPKKIATTKTKYLSRKRFLASCQKWPKEVSACLSGVAGLTLDCAALLSKLYAQGLQKGMDLFASSPKINKGKRLPEKVRKAIKALQNGLP